MVSRGLRKGLEGTLYSTERRRLPDARCKKFHSSLGESGPSKSRYNPGSLHVHQHINPTCILFFFLILLILHISPAILIRVISYILQRIYRTRNVYILCVDQCVYSWTCIFMTSWIHHYVKKIYLFNTSTSYAFNTWSKYIGITNTVKKKIIQFFEFSRKKRTK